jgi:hypothetical protein
MHGTLISQWITSSSIYKIVLTFLRHEAWKLAILSRSACPRWNEKETVEKTQANIMAQFAAAHSQHKQMQWESAANSGYHAANAAVDQT